MHHCAETRVVGVVAFVERLHLVALVAVALEEQVTHLLLRQAGEHRVLLHQVRQRALALPLADGLLLQVADDLLLLFQLLRHLLDGHLRVQVVVVVLLVALSHLLCEAIRHLHLSLQHLDLLQQLLLVLVRALDRLRHHIFDVLEVVLRVALQLSDALLQRRVLGLQTRLDVRRPLHHLAYRLVDGRGNVHRFCHLLLQLQDALAQVLLALAVNHRLLRQRLAHDRLLLRGQVLHVHIALQDRDLLLHLLVLLLQLRALLLRLHQHLAGHLAGVLQLRVQLLRVAVLRALALAQLVLQLRDTALRRRVRSALTAHDLQLLSLLVQLVLQRCVVLRDHLVVVAVALQRLQLVVQLLVLLLQVLRAMEVTTVFQVLLHGLVSALHHGILALLVFQLLLRISIVDNYYAQVAVFSNKRVVVHFRGETLLQGDDFRLLLVNQIVIVLTQRLLSIQTYNLTQYCASLNTRCFFSSSGSSVLS